MDKKIERRYKETQKGAVVKKQIDGVSIEQVDSRGRGRGRIVAGDGTERPLYVMGAYPGEIVDVHIRGRKRGAYLGEVTARRPGEGPARRPAFCRHFADCGGCTIQDLPYDEQLAYMDAIVAAAFAEYPDVPLPERAPVMGAPSERFYRNKLEYSFGAQRWLTAEEIQNDATVSDRRGLGFHAPGRFDRVIDVTECYLQPEPSEQIRDFFRELAQAHDLTFYDAREHTGLLRLLTIRTSLAGESMVIVMFGEDDPSGVDLVMAETHKRFPGLASLNYVINTTRNDSLANHTVRHYAGSEWITEICGPNRLRIRPKAFYQTNPEQAVRLYERALSLAHLQGDETVFDLYCGIGSISLFIAPHVASVVGIEVVDDAVTAARENALLNDIDNAVFVSGLVEQTLPAVIAEHGAPDVVVLDPPRAGLHPDARATINGLLPPKIVYISCNPRTQAEDIAVFSEYYDVTAMQPVDMFPQTRHVENIAVLTRR